jgi:hypothetical protein
MTVYRTGHFEVAAPEVEGKCGVFGKTKFRFDAWFTADAGDLDARGFIVDNADLFRYFRDKYSADPDYTFVSCEKMCLRALDDWREMWPTARRIKVRVWGLEEVTYVELVWERPGTQVAELLQRNAELEEQIHDAEYARLERAGSCDLTFTRNETY